MIGGEGKVGVSDEVVVQGRPLSLKRGPLERSVSLRGEVVQEGRCLRGRGGSGKVGVSANVSSRPQSAGDRSMSSARPKQRSSRPMDGPYGRPPSGGATPTAVP